MQNQTCLSSAEVQPNEGVANAPFEVPESWEWCTLAEVADIARGGSPRPIKNFLTTLSNGINWIKISDTEKGGKYINQCEQKIIPEGVRHSRFVHKGDFLLTNSMSFGRPYILNVDGCIHDGWLVISPNQGIYDKEFLYYLLSSEYAYNQFSEKASGSAVSNLNIDKVKMALFPILPLKEQARIVSTLGMWYKIIEELESEQQSLKLFTKQAKNKVLDLAIHGKLVPQEPNDEPAIELLKRINPAIKPCDISHYPNLPESWCIVKLGDIYNHTTGKALKKSNTDGVLRKYITTSNLYWNSFDLKEVRSMYFTKEELEKCTVHKGDLLLCNGGDVGRAAIWNYDEDICIQNHISRLRPKYENIAENLFYYYVLMYLKQNGLLNGKGVAITSLSAADLLSIQVPMPPKKEQVRIVQKIQEIEKRIQEICEEL